MSRQRWWKFFKHWLNQLRILSLFSDFSSHLFPGDPNPLLWSFPSEKTLLSLKYQIWRGLGGRGFPLELLEISPGLVKKGLVKKGLVWPSDDPCALLLESEWPRLWHVKKKKKKEISHHASVNWQRAGLQLIKVYCWCITDISIFYVYFIGVVFLMLVICTAGYCSVKHVNRFCFSGFAGL